jgi:ABC-type bacteriocin/lantibiotic exporter with double-glycine peptidase domain
MRQLRQLAAALLLVSSMALGRLDWLDVPFVRQEREGCGSAAASMIMRYWIGQRANVTEEAADAAVIQRKLHSSEAKGIYASALRQYLEQHGFSVYVINAEFEDLQHHVSRGRPLMVCLQFRDGEPLHYVVVVGVDSENQEIVIHDPARGALRRHNRSSFRKAWNRKGNWTLLAVPK